EAVAGAIWLLGWSWAIGRRGPVVDKFDLHATGLVADSKASVGRSYVTDDVGQCFLNDAVRGDIDARRERANMTGDFKVDVYPCLIGLSDEVVEVIESGRWFEVGVAGVVGLAQDTDEAPHLAEGAPAGRLDDRERFASILGLFIDDDTGGARAYRDETHRVGD